MSVETLVTVDHSGASYAANAASGLCTAVGLSPASVTSHRPAVTPVPNAASAVTVSDVTYAV